MRRRWLIRPVRVLAAVGGVLALAGTYWALTGRTQLRALRLPPGFRIAVYAEGLDGARQMALGDGIVFVGSRSAGRVYAVMDPDRDGIGDRVAVVDRDLALPSGVAYRDGTLYVAAVDRILRYDDIVPRLDDPPDPVVVVDDLPRETHHGWKFIAFGPDGWLYVPVGAPCNVCRPTDSRFASILRLRPDGLARQTYARGVRNTVGFDWHPETDVLWFTDNGRDFLGDDAPPDELNRAPRAGLDFGFPRCHGDTIVDPDYGTPDACRATESPAHLLGPHVAAIGMRFYDGTQFPPAYRNRVFIAEHGSWNRSSPVGYRITTVAVSDSGTHDYAPFIEGWLRGRRAWGRPADVLVMPDGALLVSDERQGKLYRVTYRGPASTG